jgi:hypothetical protein
LPILISSWLWFFEADYGFKENSMEVRPVKWIGLSVFVSVLLLGPGVQARAQQADAPYPRMAPLEQYLMADRNTEIALARTAAPKAISDNAEDRRTRFCGVLESEESFSDLLQPGCCTFLSSDHDREDQIGDRRKIKS